MSNRDIIRAWWGQRIAARDSSAARALAAKLNRGDALDCLSQPAVYDLGRTLGLLGQPDRLVQLVRVLAALREDRGGPLPRRLGEALSPMRFERLLRARDDALAEQIRRALPMVDRACDVGRLGSDLLDWSDTTRARWAIEYHGGRLPDAAPADQSPETDIDEETPA